MSSGLVWAGKDRCLVCDEVMWDQGWSESMWWTRKYNSNQIRKYIKKYQNIVPLHSPFYLRWHTHETHGVNSLLFFCLVVTAPSSGKESLL